MNYLHGDGGWRLLIYGLLVFTFFLGLPLFHYVTALMIMLILHNREHPEQADLLGILAALRTRERGSSLQATTSRARLQGTGAPDFLNME